MKKKNYRPRQIQIEQEHGKPFWDLVGELAEKGESMTAVARILKLHRPSFTRLVRHHGKVGIFRPPHETNGSIARRASEAARRALPAKIKVPRSQSPAVLAAVAKAREALRQKREQQKNAEPD